MADVKVFKGSAWGVPAQGAIINISSADVGSILAATSGLAKGLFWLGGGALAMALATVGLFALLPSKKEALPWGSLANVDTWNEKGINLRSFRGVCLTREIEINCDNHVLNVPVDYIKNYGSHKEVHGIINKNITIAVNIELFDGSRYRGTLLSPNSFEFLTPVGIQVIQCDSRHRIYGCTVVEADNLKQNVNSFLEREANTVDKLLGTERFNRFFVRT